MRLTWGGSPVARLGFELNVVAVGGQLGKEAALKTLFCVQDAGKEHFFCGGAAVLFVLGGLGGVMSWGGEE